jgi:hypothetical protein
MWTPSADLADRLDKETVKLNNLYFARKQAVDSATIIEYDQMIRMQWMVIETIVLMRDAGPNDPKEYPSVH